MEEDWALGRILKVLRNMPDGLSLVQWQRILMPNCKTARPQNSNDYILI